jgi:hypothetical protein
MTVLSPDIAKVEIAIVELTNAFRTEHKLGALAPNAELARAARTYAEFLARSNLFSHTADGRQVSDRTKAAGYAHCQVAENLALFEDSRGFETRELAHHMVEGWKGSPGHRKNMLAPHVTETGVAVAKSRGSEKYLSVQIFGRPESTSYGFRINNASRVVVTYSHGEKAHEIAPNYTIRHTACLPAPIEFRKAAGAGGSRALSARYETRDGDVFTIRGTAADQVRIEVTHGMASAGKP